MMTGRSKSSHLGSKSASVARADALDKAFSVHIGNYKYSFFFLDMKDLRTYIFQRFYAATATTTSYVANCLVELFLINF